METFRLRDFLETGEFPGLNQTSTQEDLRQTIGEPDTVGGTSRKHRVPRIWRYGGVEFTFGMSSSSTLVLIHFDAPDIPPSGSSRLEIEPWVLREGLSLDELRYACDSAGISLRKTHDAKDDEQWWQTSGGVTLVFGVDGLEAVSRRDDFEPRTRRTEHPRLKTCGQH
jgi:hypothetical protein